jgi:hypothetical protein
MRLNTSYHCSNRVALPAEDTVLLQLGGVQQCVVTHDDDLHAGAGAMPKAECLSAVQLFCCTCL